ncbi:diguanylate cyclase [Paenibacillus aestuarii]|uniref:Diguanylate cyclase n=1 Tax=Paenibacillus aestuarii TaxID=516965 RepID=A0ABW0K720_9BACL
MMNRLLIVDQDSDLREELRSQLRMDGFEADGCEGIEAAKVLISEGNYELIILDPTSEPNEHHFFIKEIKQTEKLKWVPVFILSQSASVEDKLFYFDLGVDDYLHKPFHYKEIKAKIQGILSRTSHFEEMAFKDPLTKIYNRRFFDHQISVLLQLTQRHQTPISLAFIDADKFKSINDTYGHHVGDLVLMGLASAIRTHVRSSDLVARFGGEEFVIAFPNANAQQAAVRVNEILNYVRNNPIAEHDGEQRYVTFSSGVAQWKPGMTVKSWIHLADEGVYQAKAEGRNRVIITQYKEDEGERVVKTFNVMIIESGGQISSIINSKSIDLELKVLDVNEDLKGEELHNNFSTQNVDVIIIHDENRSKERMEFINQLKRKSQRGNVKVLYVANVNEHVLLKSLNIGVDEILPVPFTEIDLEISLKRLLAD